MFHPNQLGALKEQGLSGDASDVPCLSFVYRPVNLLDAWRFLSDPSDGEGQERVPKQPSMPEKGVLSHRITSLESVAT